MMCPWPCYRDWLDTVIRSKNACIVARPRSSAPGPAADGTASQERSDGVTVKVLCSRPLSSTSREHRLGCVISLGYRDLCICCVTVMFQDSDLLRRTVCLCSKASALAAFPRKLVSCCASISNLSFALRFSNKVLVWATLPPQSLFITCELFAFVLTSGQ